MISGHPSKHPFISLMQAIHFRVTPLNKGSAFTQEERSNFNLHGLLPHIIETIEEQSQRSYQQYCAFNDDINKHIYLRNIKIPTKLCSTT